MGRVYFELARAIFDRSVGTHEKHFWQTYLIRISLKMEWLFEEAVNSIEKWSADTTDRREFDKYVNGR